jgi:hypothetical protein
MARESQRVGALMRGYQACSRANRGKSAYDRFLEKAIPEPNTGCWLWDGCFDKDGYGFIRIDGKNVKAHRFSVECELGRFLSRRELACHRCDVPECVNPAHLYVGTNSSNQIDAVTRGRRGRVKLSPVAVQEIRARRASGERPVDLAKEFDVHPSTITNIANGQKWRHLCQ